MARICREIRVDGRNLLALLDPGARYSYARRPALPAGTSVHTLREPGRSSLGGRSHTIRELGHLHGELEEVEVVWDAYLVEGIGPAEEMKRPLDLSKDPPVLDLTEARRREFFEY